MTLRVTALNDSVEAHLVAYQNSSQTEQAYVRLSCGVASPLA